MKRSVFRISYGATAVEDMAALPPRIRKQILRKIERLESGLHGDIKHLRGTDVAYRCEPVIIASCSMLTAPLS